MKTENRTLKITDRPTIKLHFEGRWTPELLLGYPTYEMEAGIGPVLGTVIEVTGVEGDVMATIAITPHGETYPAIASRIEPQPIRPSPMVGESGIKDARTRALERANLMTETELLAGRRAIDAYRIESRSRRNIND